MNNQLIMDELLSSVEEVLAISDRKHDAWDRARAAIAHYRADNSSVIFGGGWIPVGERMPQGGLLSRWPVPISKNR
ncbi:hypothetical protein NFG91_004226 [Salmonella enterica]|nr:hypothetical protein [Salmonella enterica]EJI5362876.1 hypothetical protein [Salmonella enterica]